MVYFFQRLLSLGFHLNARYIPSKLFPLTVTLIFMNRTFLVPLFFIKKIKCLTYQEIYKKLYLKYFIRPNLNEILHSRSLLLFLL
jgi:hypothetical protein